MSNLLSVENLTMKFGGLTAIDDLSFDDVETIIKNSGETRILNLFNRDHDAQEIVYVCLKIWLEKWTPSQEEKVQLLKGKVSLEKASLTIKRIWTINRENNQIIEILFGGHATLCSYGQFRIRPFDTT